MNFLPEPLQNLIDEFAKLPGIGPKSAQRIAMYLLMTHEGKVAGLSKAISEFKKDLSFCKNCWNIANAEICKICSDFGRIKNIICVVESILDAVAIEKTRNYKGVFHVLHGVLSPMDGIGPDQLKIAELIERIKNFSVDERREVEIIVATNPSIEGETTALYLYKIFKPMEIKVTRIARGLPAGGEIDYADEITLSRALQNRSEV